MERFLQPVESRTQLSLKATGCLVVLITLWSCDGVRELASTFGDLHQVGTTVAKAAGTDKVKINLRNGKDLRISITNPSLRDLPVAQRKSKALDIARRAYVSYSKSSELEKVSVTFVTERSYGGAVDYTDNTDTVDFAPTDLLTN